MDVPSGWLPPNTAAGVDGVLVDSGPPAIDGSGWGLVLTGVGAVRKDPCDSTKGTFDPSQVATVDGLVAAMSGWTGFTASPAIAATVDGYSGKLIELRSTLGAIACPAPRCCG